MRYVVSIAAVLLVTLLGHSAAHAFTVTATTNSDYVIDGQLDPTLTLARGNTYTFDVNAPGHPFWINSVSGTGTGNAYNDGVTNNGTSSGTITFTVPQSAPSTLFYNCELHAQMAGTINVVDPLPGVTPWGALALALALAAMAMWVLKRTPLQA